MTQRLSVDDLAQFSGTEHYYRHFSGLLYTDGVKFIASRAGAYWLIDAIASYQSKLNRDPGLAGFQLWELLVNDGSAVLTCRADSNKPTVVKQRIEFTDFPLSGISFYVEGGVLLLPSEH